jgi:hypothetical protein
MRPIVFCTLVIVVATVLWPGSNIAAAGEDVHGWQAPADQVVSTPVSAMLSGERDTYEGTLRVFVTEIIGRWNDWDGNPFHNAFLSFALEEDFTLNETDSLTWQLGWNGNDYFDVHGVSYGDIEESNIKVIAAVFDSDSYTGYSDPPSDHPFAVHEVDATAAAVCGKTGYNLNTSDFTHSVFVQDAGSLG